MRPAQTNNPTRLVGALCATYGLLYLGRLNLSVVLPMLAQDLNLSLAEVGALGTVFFWFYGIFQLVSGEVGSRVSPFRIVSLGILATAIINLLFAFQTSLVVMLVLWGMNGIAQSGGWSPMVRILAERLDARDIKRASTLMPFGYVIGTALTWSLIGAVTVGGNWRAGFWLPGLLLLIILALWRQAAIDVPNAKVSAPRPSVIVSEARGILFVLFVAALAGFVRNGSLIWLPTYILDTGLVADSLVGSVAALLQIIAVPGLLLAHYRVARSNQVFTTAVLMFAAGGLCFLLVALTTGPLAILLVSIALMLMNGAFNLAIASIPLLMAPPGRASSTAGTVNMMATFVGGTAGFAIGGLLEISDWGAVFALWGLVLLLAALVLWWKRAEERQ